MVPPHPSIVFWQGVNYLTPTPAPKVIAPPPGTPCAHQLRPYLLDIRAISSFSWRCFVSPFMSVNSSLRCTSSIVLRLSSALRATVLPRQHHHPIRLMTKVADASQDCLANRYSVPWTMDYRWRHEHSLIACTDTDLLL